MWSDICVLRQAELPGFYDPCIGVDKEVNIVYEFRHQLHNVTVSEKDCIMIPKEGFIFNCQFWC